ncbi:aromatic acid exporter family protein [Macrococcus equipercicus]|uniref:Aromatic acid exporter family protein n=1 Tax=Macrococcus equipercicus TaxID=69967 RepID=A0ABQ6RA32_9STAP|nr:aromatic acid exporter family protein [Macrococcus equipercicus]KAA1040145.1 aromatic acid exporter family protein [Macrococcus equipercicus]
MKNFSLKPYRIGYRTIKTAFGMALGVLIAKLLGLENFSSAAILVVLCVKNTKIKSMEAALSRLVSCMIAILFSYIFFEFLGYNPVVLGLLVLLFIPVTVMLGAQEGVVTACVIMLHCFNSGHVTPALMVNEMILLVVGLGIALILNSYMPDRQAELEQYKKRIEGDFQQILSQFSDALRYVDIKLETGVLDQLNHTIEKAKSVAFMDVENHFVRNENSYYYYFDMRGEQVELMYRMADLINEMDRADQIHSRCSDILADMSRGVSSNDYTAIRLHDLYEVRLDMKAHELPKNYQELHSRAAAMQLLKEIESYLTIKSKFGSLKNY